MQAAARTLEAQGYTAEISDLYAMRWSPGLGRGDFTHDLGEHFKPGMLWFSGFTALESVVSFCADQSVACHPRSAA